MTEKRRYRRIGSIKTELIKKSRESALAAVQIFNNPNIMFKSEIYVVLMIIAWTYLLHAYYREKKIDYRHFEEKNGRKKFDKTKKGAFKHWELERCLDEKKGPIDKDTANNLRFLIGLRHEIEHQMTTQIDDYLSARFQACCLNYNQYIKQFFGDPYGVDRHLSFSLQFSSISDEQLDLLSDRNDLPPHIQRYIDGFDGKLTDQEYNSPKYAYRVLFVAKTANTKGQADQVIEFVRADSHLAESVNAQYIITKETEKPKYLAKQIKNLMQEEGFKKFNLHHHTQLWKREDAKNPGKGYGVMVANTWYWYERWINFVRSHCNENKYLYQ
jgi:hypothetical protein